ncbi:MULTISPECIES: Rqc2 family fibronectin-binding protein [Paenibacillus]|uniref:Rqc2 family fibronectin-binding protein n=1 Tax=Paenibacillus TaxID=44249 RepID=UPI0022B89677|nr:NFACT RNA binding domain-containing protein [Paenibacillus caseinilyticus]MCZ8520212.1 NFACT RNA binding domain-containing protein [Paenibacillus caseinilyticus]
MSFDGLVVHCLVRELQSLVGGRINKIQMPTGNDILLQVRAPGRSVKLILSANPTYPRVHLTGESFLNPKEAPMFCMLLRKHCEGGIIESIEQPGLERIIHFGIRQRDELGDLSTKKIIVEIMGRHSNIILTDPAGNTIIDGIHHVTPAISSYRIVMPGSSYTSPPEQHKAMPLETAQSSFLAELTAAPQTAEPEDASSLRYWAGALVQRFSGISPLAARELVHRAAGGQAELDPAEAPARLWPPFAELMQSLRSGEAEPVIAEEAATGKSFFSILRLTHIEGESRRFDTVSELLETYYSDKAERDTVKQRVSDLIRLLSNERAKNAKKLEKLQETMEDARDADRFRILGELLTASMHLLRKGEKKIEVVNYYDEEQRPVTIELDPLLTPSENAQRYFKKYTKSKNSLIAVDEQMTQAREEILYLDSLLQQLASASLSDIEEIREELMEQGYLRARGRKGTKKKANAKPVLACYTSSEGIPIYVGKNNTQNEYLTNRLAHAGDTWLHTKDIPGSHVVIRSPEFGEDTLREAAQLAAFYSQAKESSGVPVDYTLIKHVRKPSGAKPGFVIYDHQRTLFVTPDAERIKGLPVTAK